MNTESPDVAAPAGAAALSLVERARLVMYFAHLGQTDKIGTPYYGHPERVAARVAAAGYGEKYVAVALLHDVVEDSDWTLEELLAVGFPADVVAGVESLTKRKNEPNVDAAHRAGANEYGCVVKAADVADNTDPARVAELDEVDRERLDVKYANTRAVLASYGAPVFA